MSTLALGMPHGWEWLLLLALGLLLFGRRLPDVGRSLGKSIVEFRKGIKGIEDEIETSTSQTTRSESKTLPEKSGVTLRSDERAVSHAPAPDSAPPAAQP